MNSKEKAEDLVDSYRAILMNEDTDCGEECLCTMIAVKFAIKSVELHLEELSKMKLIFSDREIRYKYWREVLKHIKEY